ncbi:MAG: hypothetical protein K2O89_02485 [Clostridia bacterium]|nr:hypothetical protein [Clostridia bacterium]
MQKFDVLDQLLETYKALMPKTVYLVKNKKRYDEAIKAICEIASDAVSADSEAKVKISPDPLTGSSLCLEVTTSLIIVDFLDKFCVALKKADNFEVYPRTDGLLNFNVVFENAFVAAPTHGSKEVR